MPTKISAFGDSKAVIADEGDKRNKKSSSRQHVLEGSQTFLLFLYYENCSCKLFSCNSM